MSCSFPATKAFDFKPNNFPVFVSQLNAEDFQVGLPSQTAGGNLMCKAHLLRGFVFVFQIVSDSLDPAIIIL